MANRVISASRQIAFLRRHRLEQRQRLADMFNKEFGRSLNIAQIKAALSLYGFQLAPEEFAEQARIRGRGRLPTWTLPIGTERMQKGGLMRKVAEGGERHRNNWRKDWAYVHVINWTEQHGPIPDGHKLMRLGEEGDSRPENYMIVPAGAVTKVHARWPSGLVSAPEPLRRAIVLSAILEYQMGPRGTLPVEALPTSAASAREAGIAYYFSGRLCPDRHRAPRLARDSSCSRCILDMRSSHEAKAKHNERQRRVRRILSRSRKEGDTHD